MSLLVPLLLKAELDADLDSTISPGGDAVINVKLSNCQKWLQRNHDFDDLRIRPELTMVPGTRYYDFPVFDTNAVLETNLAIKVECYWSTLWYSVGQGIKLINYNTLNPDLAQRLDPVIYWQKYRASKTSLQLEVWPIPATATKLRLTGQKRLAALAGDADTCELDDLLIVQWTAAKMLAGLKSADAAAMLEEAKRTLQRIIGGDNAPSQKFSMNGSRGAMRRRDSDRPTVAVNFTP